MVYLFCNLFLSIIQFHSFNFNPKEISHNYERLPIILQKELAQKKEITLHKIWIYKTAKPVKGSICTMCGMSKITMIDLTKKDTLTYEVNDSLISKPYRFVNNYIIDSDQIKFRISKLTRNRLGLIVVADYKNGENKFKGDLFEILFEEKKK